MARWLNERTTQHQRGRRPALAGAALTLMAITHITVSAQVQDMVVRISEIHIESRYLDEYTAILKEEAEASVRMEPGVLAIFPMQQADNPAELRILEIYASREAYESHLKSPHFERYKTTTLKMVKSLKLVTMKPIDTETMTRIFAKLQR